MAWIHCNTCFVQPNPKNVANKLFFLTTCGHVFCETCGCFTDSTSKKCKECKSNCSYTTIGDKAFQTNRQVLEYFQEPNNVCTKLLQVMKFQKAHQNKLVAHHQRILLKYNRAKMYIKKLENQLEIAKKALNGNNIMFPELTNTQDKNPIFQMNSTPFKLIKEDARHRNSCNDVVFKQPDMNYRKNNHHQSNVSLSSVSTGSGMQTPGSSSTCKSQNQARPNANVLSVSKLYLGSNGSLI
ncbi:probable E3 SUMO-protein ligase RNF212 [Adelges cooleyi]|uniref:probable E3 SUMO-protein ligase RNF212 n=1 Tax=Adelges cooleyi TaxID=133065 RepID=UPI0021803C14|nr:probable E3 SUMO-protein ligase RNF212 [Adelges cooleyi]